MDHHRRKSRSHVKKDPKITNHQQHHNENEEDPFSRTKSKSRKRKSRGPKRNTQSTSKKYDLNDPFYQRRSSRTNRQKENIRDFDKRNRTKGSIRNGSSSRSNEMDERARSRRKRRRGINSKVHDKNEESLDEYPLLPLSYKSVSHKDESDHSVDHLYSHRHPSSPLHLSSSAYAREREKYSKSRQRTRSRIYPRKRREKRYSPNGISQDQRLFHVQQENQHIHYSQSSYPYMNAYAPPHEMIQNRSSTKHKKSSNLSSSSFDSANSHNYMPSSRTTHHRKYISTSSRHRDHHDSRNDDRYKHSSHRKQKSKRSENQREKDTKDRISMSDNYAYTSSSLRHHPHSLREGKHRQEQKHYRKHHTSDSDDSEREEARKRREHQNRKAEQAYYYQLMKKMNQRKQHGREYKRKRKRENKSSSESSDEEYHNRNSRDHSYRRDSRSIHNNRSYSKDRQSGVKRTITRSRYSRSDSRPNSHSYSRKRSHRHIPKYDSKRSGKKKRYKSPSTSSSSSDSEDRHNNIGTHQMRPRGRVHESYHNRSRLHHNHNSRNHHNNAVVSEEDWEIEEESSTSEKRSSSDDRSRQSSKSWSSSADEEGNDDDNDAEEDDGSSSQRDDSIGHFEGGPGTLIKDRYKVVKDVGMGTFGRVVECTDLKASNSSNRSSRKVSVSTSTSSTSSKRSRSRMNNVAIKIVRNVKRYHESALIEADILKDVNRRGGRGKNLCAKLLDQFDLKSGHYCLVFECLGMSLYDFLKSHKYAPFPMYCVRDFAHQLLDALEFLHSFDLIHTDLKPENILLVSNQEEVYRTNDGSRYMVPKSTKIKVIDFGGASYDHEKKSSVVNTRQYRAPEVILNLGWSTPSDLWSAGCIIAELYLGELLFATHDNAEHLALMECAIGCFPKSMLTRSNTNVAKHSFDSTGLHKRKRILSPRKEAHVRKMTSLEALVDDGGLVGDSGINIRTKSSFVSLLRSLLSIDPKIRASASVALQSNYFKYEY